MTMEYELPEDLKMLRQAIREFAEKEVAPIAREIDEQERVPFEVLKKAGELGLLGVPFPEQYGGADAGVVGYCVLMEELQRKCASTATIIGAHAQLCAMSIYLSGSDDQKQRYLQALCEGRKLGAWALTEPGAGSDAAHIRTTATQQGDDWVLNGSKMWITNGSFADVLVVFAANDRSLGARGGITAFIVEKDFPGFRVGKVDEKMGLRGSYTAELVFEDCAVPEANVLGEVGAGFRTALAALDVGRVSLAAGAVGTSQHLLETAIAHSKRRQQFGRPIAANQAIQWMLADSAVEIHAARLMVYDAAWKLDHGVRASREAAIVKVFASEMANRVADRVLQIHGGMGYMKDSVVERAYRDARILRIYEGTSEIQRTIIAEDLLRS